MRITSDIYFFMDVGIWFLTVVITPESLTPAQAPNDYYIFASNYIL